MYTWKIFSEFLKLCNGILKKSFRPCKLCFGSNTYDINRNQSSICAIRLINLSLTYILEHAVLKKLNIEIMIESRRYRFYFSAKSTEAAMKKVLCAIILNITKFEKQMLVIVKKPISQNVCSFVGTHFFSEGGKLAQRGQ